VEVTLKIAILTSKSPIFPNLKKVLDQWLTKKIDFRLWLSRQKKLRQRERERGRKRAKDPPFGTK